MSQHINATEYECKKCKYKFIAYSKGLGCPACETPESSNGEEYDFMNKLAWSMRVHKSKYGRYTPNAWFKGCLSDWLQSACFEAFDYIRANPDKSIDSVLEKYRLADPGNVDPNNIQIRRVIFLLWSVHDYYSDLPRKRGLWERFKSNFYYRYQD